MKVLAVFAVLAASPVASPALAECPTAAALDGPGVAVSFEDGTVLVFTREPTGGLRSVSLGGGAIDHVLLLEEAVFPTLGFRVEQGVPLSRGSAGYAYGAPLPGAEDLTPGARFEIPYVMTLEGEAMDAMMQVTVAAREPIELGPCRYAAYEVMLVQQVPDGAATARLAFLPEIGVPVWLASRWNEDPWVEIAPTGIAVHEGGD